jgi:hypothetical protein
MPTWIEIVNFIENSRAEVIREILEKCTSELIKRSCQNLDQLVDEKCKTDLLELELQQLKDYYRPD